MIETKTPKILRIVFCFVLLFLGDVGSQLALDYPGTKPRIICLHGHASSGAITKKQISIWPDIVLDKLDLVFIDALYPVQHSSHEDTDDPPYYEWWQTNENVTEIINLKDSIDYLEANMIKHGPFDGVLGFSQGALIAAALPGMQREGVVLTKVSRIKFVIIIAGAKLGVSNNLLFPLAANAYSPPINCPSLHFIGEMDFLTKDKHNDLLSSFVDPVVIHHPEGHVIPHLDNNSLEVVLSFIKKTSQISKQDNFSYKM